MLTFDAVVRDEAAGQFTVVVEGDLDLMTVPLFLGAATSALDQAEAATLRVDLSGVAFIDSAGIDALIRISEAARLRGRVLELAGASRPVERLLQLAGLGDTFA